MNRGIENALFCIFITFLLKKVYFLYFLKRDLFYPTYFKSLETLNKFYHDFKNLI